MTTSNRAEPMAPWTALALALIPCAVLLGGRAVLAMKRPATARASTVATIETPLIIPAHPVLTEAQADLRTTMREIAARGFGPSPVVSRQQEAPPPKTPEVDSVPVSPGNPAPEEPPALTLRAVMHSGGSPLAVIDGKVRRVGDEVAPRWTIGEIDAAGGTVTLLGPEGRTHTLNMRRR